MNWGKAFWKLIIAHPLSSHLLSAHPLIAHHLIAHPLSAQSLSAHIHEYRWLIKKAMGFEYSGIGRKWDCGTGRLGDWETVRR